MPVLARVHPRKRNQCEWEGGREGGREGDGVGGGLERERGW